MRYLEHLAIGKYEFVEIQADSLKDLIKFRKEYADDHNRNVAEMREEALKFNAPASEEKSTNGAKDQNTQESATSISKKSTPGPKGKSSSTAKSVTK